MTAREGSNHCNRCAQISGATRIVMDPWLRKFVLQDKIAAMHRVRSPSPGSSASGSRPRPAPPKVAEPGSHRPVEGANEDAYHHPPHRALRPHRSSAAALERLRRASRLTPKANLRGERPRASVEASVVRLKRVVQGDSSEPQKLPLGEDRSRQAGGVHGKLLVCIPG
jgi:hypothetical protein